VASVSFVLLASSAKTSSLHVRGALTKNYRTAYDILVRPRHSSLPLENAQGLVRDNFLSGIFGGITPSEYREIRTLPGVSVAAPIANVGYVLLAQTIPIRLTPFLNSEPAQLYRVKFSYVAQNGLSHYSAGDQYVYYAPQGRFVRSPIFGQLVGGSAAPLPICYGFPLQQPPPTGPFDRSAASVLNCYSGASRARSGFEKFVGTGFNAYFPIMLSAIDPVQEARLLHLDEAVVGGRYLTATDKPSISLSTDKRSGRRSGIQFIPVIASSRTFLQETLHASIQKLDVPPGLNVPQMLAAGSCAIDFVPCPAADQYGPPRGAPYSDAYDFLTKLSGRVVGRQGVSAATLYSQLLHGTFQAGRVDFDSYWDVSPVRYHAVANDHLVPLRTTNDPTVIWESRLAFGGYYQAPADNQDVQFRELHQHVGDNTFGGRGASVLQTPRLKVIGTYDPSRLPGFSPLSKVPLETYESPTLAPGNPASARLLGGQPLQPNQNLGDYIAQPPLLLTTLSSLGSLLNRSHFSNLSARQLAAPISVIRVRVSGVTGPDALSQTRIRTVAQLIHDRTGLTVDITAGSSPHPLLVSLPAGKFGRPALVLREGWSKKGVSLAFLRAVDRKDLALFALILVICTLFLSNGAVASVRSRRAEIGTLLTLGWSQGTIFRVVLGEIVLVGAAAGALGTGLAALLVWISSLHLQPAATLLVMPVSICLTLVAGVMPAWDAARGRPLDALRPAVNVGAARRAVRSLPALAFVNLRRLPVRTMLGSTGLAIGVAALTVLVGIERAFQGTLVGTLLGNTISLQVRGADFVAIALTLVLAGVSVADVLYLNLRERAPEIVTLRTSGWSEAQLAAVVSLEAFGLGMIGGLGGGGVGFVAGWLLLSLPGWPLLAAASLSALIGIGAALVASLAPLVQLRRLTPPVVLAAD
jgi:putative ABC transport system permease protein